MSSSSASDETGDRTATNVLRAIVIAAMVGLSIYLIASLATAIGSSSLAAPLVLDLPVESITAPYPNEATILDATARVDVETGIGYRLAWWAVTDGVAIMAIGFLEQLRRLLAESRDPFTAENASRLRTMTILAVAFAGVGLVRPAVAIAVQDAAGFDDLQATWSFEALGFALILAALLEVWRHGVALRTDRNLTI